MNKLFQIMKLLFGLSVGIFLFIIVTAFGTIFFLMASIILFIMGIILILKRRKNK